MMTYRISYQNGKTEEVESAEDAVEILGNQYPEAVFGEWEYNEPSKQRMLVWENEEIAGEPGSGDDGSHAVAEIIMREVA
jgi:hypothetical protein